MEIDIVIKKAIEAAVRENGQSPDLAKKIVAWVTAFAAGSENLQAGDSAERHLAVLYESVELNSDD